MRTSYAKVDIKRKIKEWTKSLPKDLRKKVYKHCYVTGGALASLLTGEQVNDYDVYLSDKATLKELSKHYIDMLSGKKDAKINSVEVDDTDEGVSIMIQSAGVLKDSSADYEYFESTNGSEAFEYLKAGKREDKPYKPVIITQNAISLTSDVQIILRFCGEPSEVHKNYDFDHCKCWYWPAKDELGLPKEALLSLTTRDLSYSGSKYPLCSVIRTRKFINRGWNIHAGEYLKMALQLTKLDLTNIETLKDQLTGVDAWYFRELIQILAKDSKEGKQVDSTYIGELINELY